MVPSQRPSSTSSYLRWQLELAAWQAADLIAMNHFDMLRPQSLVALTVCPNALQDLRAFACKTGLFGAGLYFAENSSKSDE